MLGGFSIPSSPKKGSLGRGNSNDIVLVILVSRLDTWLSVSSYDHGNSRDIVPVACFRSGGNSFLVLLRLEGTPLLASLFPHDIKDNRH